MVEIVDFICANVNTFNKVIGAFHNSDTRWVSKSDNITDFELVFHVGTLSLIGGEVKLF